MEVYKVMFTGLGNMNLDELKSFIIKNAPGTNEFSLKSLDIEYGSRGIPIGYLTCSSKVNAEFIATKTNNKNIENLQISSKVISKTIDYGTTILFNQSAAPQPSSAPRIPRHEPVIPNNSAIRPPSIPGSVQKPAIPKLPAQLSVRHAPDSPNVHNQPPQREIEQNAEPAEKPQIEFEENSDVVQLPDNPNDSDAIEPEPARTSSEPKRKPHRSHHRHHRHRHHRHSYSSDYESSPDSYSQSSSSSSDDGKRRRRSHKHSSRSKNSKDSSNSNQNNSESDD
ncbi:hypothetical protein TVAG_484080 [Trichomonas vaginalis G3]|uniref:RRM domain-containing protein n=1 Tax=Trichomonas vaginalis (strain ATCC PRA-98 / G3) TaxID=412133 RepID=A2EA51_TRIV3|nr:hypothetical protein TVAGG3_0980750 [Trichomonas vaginalis G3]EAY10497.1 hypothetical protein TVAG_484080 [Trichomonas vaginalis G3]KAI5489275.1 hypothetical protein TVAGG3_0980750 [Trichomonas vaginalis G3]|eukprot:XP_001322720.1 hypothetical protein [Trichomonas vaginalis G3]